MSASCTIYLTYLATTVASRKVSRSSLYCFWVACRSTYSTSRLFKRYSTRRRRTITYLISRSPTARKSRGPRRSSKLNRAQRNQKTRPFAKKCLYCALLSLRTASASNYGLQKHSKTSCAVDVRRIDCGGSTQKARSASTSVWTWSN